MPTDVPTHSTGNDERPEPGDEELIARSQAGERVAFNALVRRYEGAVYALALRMLGDPDTAADVTQESLIAAFRAIGTFAGGAFRPWLLRIASNRCIDVFRRRARHPAVSLDALLEAEGDAGLPLTSTMPSLASADEWNPEQAALRAETISAIGRALLRLPEDQRLAILLCDVEGLPYDEIAQVMEVPLGTVKSRIARGRAALRAILTAVELFAPVERPATGDPKRPPGQT